VPLPTHHACDFVDSCALGALQHRNDRILLRRAPRVRLTVRVRQGLNRRPQLIDKRIAVADLRLLLDTRERIPHRQQALAAEPSGVQLLPRGDSYFALVHGGRRLAAQRDSVIADNVNAHRWVS
jgi:hypothetical protein